MNDELAATGSAALARRPTWSRLSDCPRCVLHGPNLRRTASTALVVGSVLFVINHLVAVLHGHAGTAVWAATGLSFVVPFIVANAGVLFASRRQPSPAGTGIRVRAAPTWRRLSDCPRCVLHPPHLARTAATALVVGTLYFFINHLDAVTSGHTTSAVWFAAGLTYLVPFSVANVGILVGCRAIEGSG